MSTVHWLRRALILVIALCFCGVGVPARADGVSDQGADNNYEMEIREFKRWRQFSDQQKQDHRERVEQQYRDCMKDARTRADRRQCAAIDTIARCDPDGCVVIDPEEVARRVIARMVFPDAAPVFGPDPGANRIAPGKLVVGFPYWMSVAGQTSLTTSETSEGLSLRMDARRTKVAYSMGDGTELSCVRTAAWPGERDGYDGRGIPRPSPVCGHVYAATGTVRVTATVHWEVTWHGGGQSGVVPLTFTDSLDLQVVEFHTVIR